MYSQELINRLSERYKADTNVCDGVAASVEEHKKINSVLSPESIVQIG